MKHSVLKTVFDPSQTNWSAHVPPSSQSASGCVDLPALRWLELLHYNRQLPTLLHKQLFDSIKSQQLATSDLFQQCESVLLQCQQFSSTLENYTSGEVVSLKSSLSTALSHRLSTAEPEQSTIPNAQSFELHRTVEQTLVSGSIESE